MSIISNNNNSRITSPVLTVGADITYFARIYPQSSGKGGFGIIALQGPLATYRTLLALWSAAPNLLTFFAGWSTTSPVWANAMPVPFGRWSSVGVSYDQSAVGNQPALYVNGATQPNTAAPVAIGNARADGVALYAAGEPTSTYDFDGYIADWAVWSRALTPFQMALVHVLGPLAVPADLEIYWPFPSAAASAQDYSGNARHGTITSALVGPDHNAIARVLPLAPGGPLVPATARFDVKGVSYDPATARLTYTFQEF